MERIRQIMVWAAAAVFVVAGCANQTQAQKKQDLKEQWGKDVGTANLPVVRDLLDHGRIDEAKKILKESYKTNSENPETHFLIARIHLAEGRDDKARQSLEKSLELDDQMEEAWFAMGILHQDKNGYDQALTCYQKALQLQPAKVEYILALMHLYTVKGQIQQARQLLEEKQKLLPYDPELIIASADLAQRSGDPEEAIRLYKEAILRQGNNPRLLEALGICYMARQQWRQAADVFDKLLHTQQDHSQEHILGWLAFCSLQAGQYGKALNYYDRLSIQRREDPQVWLEMGQAALGAEEPDRARYCGEKALQLQPAWTDAEVVIGCALYMKKNYAGAVQVFQKICQNPQWEAFGWWMAGRCYQQLGQNALARSAFEKASQLKPDSPMMQMLMGEGNNTL